MGALEHEVSGDFGESVRSFSFGDGGPGVGVGPGVGPPKSVTSRYRSEAVLRGRPE